jgi:hypothetical protein
MKFLMVAFAFLFNPFLILAQRATLVNDTLHYKDRRFTVGDTVNVAYGSGQDGRFLFVSYGSGIGGFDPLPNSMHNIVAVVDKVYKNSSGVWVRCKIIEGIAKNPLGGKLLIDPQGAIDKKEID